MRPKITELTRNKLTESTAARLWTLFGLCQCLAVTLVAMIRPYPRDPFDYLNIYIYQACGPLTLLLWRNESIIAAVVGLAAACVALVLPFVQRATWPRFLLACLGIVLWIMSSVAAMFPGG